MTTVHEPTDNPDPTTAIPPHIARVDYAADTWRCSCGRGGKGDRRPADSLMAYDDAGEKALRHTRKAADAVIRLLTREQLAAALRAGEADSQLTAAVELVIAHGHWLGFGSLRRHMVGDWGRDGTFAVRITWGTVAAAVGALDDAVRILKDADSVGYEAADALERWMKAVGEPERIQGSSSEIAILRVAASIMGYLRLDLGNDTSNLDNSNRGRVLTAIGHLLSHGGQVPFRAATTWHSYPTRATSAGEEPVR